MDSALKIYSWKGFFVETVEATEISSRGSARNIGPFATPDRRELVTWVQSSWQNGRRVRRSHFRRLPGAQLTGARRQQIESDLDSELEVRRGSTIHNQCRDLLAAALTKRIGTPLSWFVPGQEMSDFTFRGDLLRGVEAVETEYRVKTPFGKDYVLDVALLGPVIGKKRILLGGVELELHHEFEHLKCLLCKCFGFPLVSIDISEFSYADLDENKLIRVVTETTSSSGDGRRRNFFYLHPCLLPVYLDVPVGIISEVKHQFVVFARDERFEKIVKFLKLLRDSLSLDPSLYNIDVVRPKGDAGAKMIENEGGIAGHDWKTYNSNQYIRLSAPRPRGESDANYFFHLTFAQIVNAHEPALIGYKYERSIANSNLDSPVWIKRKFGLGTWKDYRICPKHLSDPIESILRAIASVGTSASV